MKQNLTCILLLICCWQQILLAQIPGFDKVRWAALSSAQRCRFIHELELETLDSAAFMAICLPLTVIAEKEQDHRVAWLLQFYCFQQRGNLKRSAEDNIALLSELEKSASDEGWQTEQIVAGHYLAFEKHYAGQLPHEALYVHILKEFGQMEVFGFEKFRDFNMLWLTYHNGRFMYQLDDFDKALQFFHVGEKFIETTKSGGHISILVLNHLQTIYQHQKDYEKGIAYAQKILRIAQSSSTANPAEQIFYRQWQGLASVDIASMLVGQGKLAEGEAFADQGYELAKATDKIVSLAAMNLEYEALQVLIFTKLELGKLEDAGLLLRRLDELYDRVGGHYENYFNNIEYFECHAKYEEMRGALAAAMRYTRLAQPLQDSLERRNDARKLEQLKQRLDAEKYTERIRLIENEKELQEWLRNAAFAILTLMLLLAYGWFHRQRHLRRQKEAELEAARSELAALTQNFREKSEIAANLRLELENRSATGERSQYLEQLTRSTILTDDDWLRFRTVFEKVHPGFMEEQKTLQPDLTPAELRYLVLEKLQLSTHEMANMLGVNDNTVRKTRARLRRKIEREEER
ncbi:MAG: hypothetical protein IPJ82_23630 [Lewinellaceae bacterium]|nr:hypothetical protein [Lewinellaceae bacterium]